MSSDSRKQIGERILRLRLALGYEQARAFGQLVGFTDQALSNYEKGERRPNVDEAIKLAAKTGASLDWIYRGLDHTLPKHLLDRLSEYDRKQAEKAEGAKKAQNG